MFNLTSTRLLTLAMALALVPALAACADEAEDPMVEEPMTEEPMVDEPMADEPMSDDMMASDVTVDGTISALEGGITSLAPTAAVGNINGWIARLEDADFDGSDDIVDALEELRDELQETPIDGDDVAELLQELGEDTAAAAGSNAGLQRLASLLTSAGESLSAGM